MAYDKDRVVTFSLKPHDERAKKLILEMKAIVIREGLPSFSYIVVQALREYKERHHADE